MATKQAHNLVSELSLAFGGIVVGRIMKSVTMAHVSRQTKRFGAYRLYCLVDHPFQVFDVEKVRTERKMSTKT